MQPSRLAAVLGFLGAFIGSFLPWVTVGVFSVAGTDGDGGITLALALVGGLVIGLSRSPAASIVAGLIALAVVGVASYDAVNISNKANAANTIVQLHASIGAGLVLVLVSSIMASFASFAHAGAQGKSRPIQEFACSECSFTVRSDARYCPNCGVEFSPPQVRRYRRVE